MSATILKYVVVLKTKEKTQKCVGFAFWGTYPDFQGQPEAPTAALKEQKKIFSKHRQMIPHFKAYDEQIQKKYRNDG